MSSTVKAKERANKEVHAIVHIDGTSRLQIPNENSQISILLENLVKLNHPALLLNTSFNLKGELNVESPADAVRTFYSSGLDYLYIGGYLIEK